MQRSLSLLLAGLILGVGNQAWTEERYPQRPIETPRHSEDAPPAPPDAVSSDVDELLLNALFEDARETSPSRTPMVRRNPVRVAGPARPRAMVAPQQADLPRPVAAAARTSGRLHVIRYDGVALSEAMQLFSDETGHNVICSAQAGQVEITAYLRDVAPLEALEAIVKANGLFYRIDQESGIVRISTADEYEKDLTSFRDEQTRVFTLLYPNPVAVAQVIAQVFGDRVEWNTADSDTDALQDLSHRFNRFDLVDGRSLGLGTFDHSGNSNQSPLAASPYARSNLNASQPFPLGANNLSSRSRRQNNRDTTADPSLARQPLTASAGLSNTEIQAIENELARSGSLTDHSRGRLMQRANATIYVSTIRRNNQIVVRTGDAKSMEEIETLVAQLDVPTPTVLLEVKVLRIQLADGLNSAFEYFIGNDDGSLQFTDGNLASAIPGENANSRALANGLGVSGAIPGALTFRIVDDKFSFRMQLLESENRVTALATPLILTANNEVSRIFVGDTLPFTVGFTPSQVVGGVNAVSGAVAAAPITELRDVGQSLLITPSINADRTVTLRVVEENSERILGGASIPVPDVDGSGVTAVQVDTVRRRTVSGTVVAEDGKAVALGGLIEEHASDAKDQIPLLGDLPAVGTLFQRKAVSQRRSELVVLIRPYVFNTPTESAATSQAVLGSLSVHPDMQRSTADVQHVLPFKATLTDEECRQRAALVRFHNVQGVD